MELAQGGDDSAFEDLYRRYYRRLYRYCLRRVGDPHDAEEVVQETFVRAVSALPRFAGERRFYPWLTVIASRLCVDTHRRHARTEPAADIDLGTVEVEYEKRLVDAEDRALLMAALDRLGPRHREVLRLREELGLSYQAIAEEFDVSIGTVEALLWRARKALKREYLAVAGTDARLAGLPVLGWLTRRWIALRAKLEPLAHSVPLAAGGAAAGVAIVSGLMLPGAGSGATQVHEVNVPAAQMTLSPAGAAAAAATAETAAGAAAAAGSATTEPPAGSRMRIGSVVLSGDESDRQWAEDAPVGISVPIVGTVGADPAPVAGAINELGRVTK